MHIQIAISIFRVTFPWKLCENCIARSFSTIGLLRTEGGGEITEHLNTDSLLLAMTGNTLT